MIMVGKVPTAMEFTVDAQPTLSPQRVPLHGANYHPELNDGQAWSSAQYHLSSKLISNSELSLDT